MAPPILSSLQNLASKILSLIPSCSADSGESSVKPTIAEEIEKLRKLVSRIQATVVDAEERDVTDESVKLLLLDLKQVAYDAENILSDFNYELLSVELEHVFQVNSQKRKFEVIDSIVSPIFDDSILNRIKRVVERFEEIRQHWAVLSLSEVDGARKLANTRPPSSSFMNSTEIFGRHDCKTHIINTMLGINERASANVKVISILSMGGMGKTTLAKLVYNDEMVERHFEVRSWVWVSENFDEIAISRSILESIVKRSCEFIQLNDLQNQLKENLRGKRFLLILDDLWNDKQTRWDVVLGPLLHGAKGSCILITTRSSNVAKVGRTNLLIPLCGLPEKDSWPLFCHHAFSGVDPSSLPQNLVAIGQKIVKKCNGVPLVIRTLGSLLAHETEEEVWEYVLNSEVWELEECKTTIIHILKLSYRLLPSHLKPCFTYCAAFPKGYVFELKNLVHLWLAQGFIQQHSRKQMEEVGQMYARDLLERSFFQNLPATDSTNNVTMHDLMHDLAQAITCEEILVVENEQLNRVCGRKNLRHLTILVKREGNIFLERCLDGLSLKSLIIIGCNMANFLLEEYFFKNKSFANLCVLDLNFWASDEVPTAISNLKHLRYLGLSGQKLPESICDLYHLETLNLRTSKGKSQFKSAAPLKLPRNINHLINLRHLLIDPWDILMMPQGIGSLTNLQSLPLFILSKNHESASLRELKELTNLSGILEISNLNHTMHEHAIEANLKSKKHLNHLILSFRINFSDGEIYALTEVLNYLRPHTNIQQITVQHYGGAELPSWFEDHSFFKLTKLKLIGCSNCKKLPAIGQLPYLKYLKLEGFTHLENVGSELLGNNTIAFPSLEVLNICNMSILMSWWYEEERKIIFPRLREVHVSFCGALSWFQLPINAPLEKLNISWCDRLQTIHGLEGSWSVIEHWKSLLDSSKEQDDEILSMLHHELNILDSRVLKLRKKMEGKSVPAHLILTIVGCPLLQKSYLTCTANKVRPTTEGTKQTEETISLSIGEESGGFSNTILRTLRRKMPDLVISEAELEPQVLVTTSRNLLETIKKFRPFILHDHNPLSNACRAHERIKEYYKNIKNFPQDENDLDPTGFHFKMTQDKDNSNSNIYNQTNANLET